MYKVILHPSRRFIYGGDGSFSQRLLWLPSHQIKCRAQVGGVVVTCTLTLLLSHNRSFSLVEVQGVTEVSVGDGGELCYCVCDDDDNGNAWKNLRRVYLSSCLSDTLSSYNYVFLDIQEHVTE